MAFHRVCSLDNPWEGEMEVFEVDGKVLTCPAHLWPFDVITGEGVNPDDAELVPYPVKIENDEIDVGL